MKKNCIIFLLKKNAKESYGVYINFNLLKIWAQKANKYLFLLPISKFCLDRLRVTPLCYYFLNISTVIL